MVLVAGGAAATWALTRPSAAATATQYRQVTVSTGTIRQSVSASGTIQPERTEDLNFSASGEVTAVYVTSGQAVTKGQRLATVDSAALRSSVAQANAVLAAAKARLSTDEDDDASSEQIAADKASITVATAQLASAKAALAGATLTAPMAGTVTAVTITVGEQVAGGSSSSDSSADSGGSGGTGDSPTGQDGSSADSSSSSSSSSTAAIQVVSTGSYVVNASVDASDVKLIKKNNQVTITASGATENVFGLVSSVGIVATSDSGVASFPVVVDVTGSPSGLYAGATASLQIVYRQLSNVLVVPTLAIDRSGRSAYVLVPDGTGSARREVVVGTSSGGQTQIVSGLAEGDRVLVAIPAGGGGNGGGSETGGTGRNGNRAPGGGFVDGGFGPPGGGPPPGGAVVGPGS